MIDARTLHLVLGVLTGWLDRREGEALAYLIEENRLQRRQLGGRRLRLNDDDRRRLAARAYRVARPANPSSSRETRECFAGLFHVRRVLDPGPAPTLLVTTLADGLKTMDPGPSRLG